MDRYIAHLIGHPAHIMIHCGCTKVIAAQPGFFLDKLGVDATVEIAEARMRCPKCKQRPNLYPKGDYGVTGGRDRRRNPPPMPSWVDLS